MSASFPSRVETGSESYPRHPVCGLRPLPPYCDFRESIKVFDISQKTVDFLLVRRDRASGVGSPGPETPTGLGRSLVSSPRRCGIQDEVDQRHRVIPHSMRDPGCSRPVTPLCVGAKWWQCAAMTGSPLFGGEDTNAVIPAKAGNQNGARPATPLCVGAKQRHYVAVPWSPAPLCHPPGDAGSRVQQVADACQPRGKVGRSSEP
jgi:hypothetical protein